MQRIFHTPEGVRDIYSQECSRKQKLQEKLHRVFHQYGFEDIETPTFEYFEVFSKEVGTIPSRDLYKFFDREGNTLVLRPDFTPSVSRACATYFNPEKEVVSLCYTGNTFINNSSFRGRLKETTQMGVERMGDDSPEADAEILAMTVECLLATGLTEFQVSVGQVDYYKAIFAQTGLSQEEEEELRELISQKNYFGVEELVKNKNMDKSLARVLSQLPQMFGSTEVLEKAKSLTDNPQALKAVARLEEIYELLKVYGYEKYVFFDLGLLSKFHYYTGIIFQAYTYGTGEPIVKGGRYDALLQHCGKKAPAIGFCTVMESLMNALERQKISLPIANTKTMLLYPDFLQPLAVKLANEHRSKGMDVALVCFARDKVLADYEEYGRKNQFGGIVYIQKSDSVLAIDLSTGEVQPVEL